MISTFDVELREMPLRVAVDQRRLEIGDDLAVRFHASGTPNMQVVVVPAGGGPETAADSQTTGGIIDGTLTFTTDLFMPSAYEAALVSKQGKKIASIPFRLYEQGAETTVTTTKRAYMSGEPIVVSWANAPGYFGDRLDIYHGDIEGKNPVKETVYAGHGGGNMRYLCYDYTHKAIEGAATFSE
ncbi:MAG: hypothetical protein JW880_04160 [Candidatus Thermoplasmatota archaeon]|nr:hypothetical protein [Candidatus Thermoplasmatota archaeon]